jgi:hypothetical protein
MPFWVAGAGPGMRVVTARVMVDLVGPSETAPPQVSERFSGVVVEAGVGVYLGRWKGLNARAEATEGIARRTERCMAAGSWLVKNESWLVE